MVPEPSDINEQGSEKKSQDQSTDSANTNGNGHAINSTSHEEPELRNTSCDQNGDQMDRDKEGRKKAEERVVWIRCDVYDTGIGIPGTFFHVSSISMNVGSIFCADIKLCFLNLTRQSMLCRICSKNTCKLGRIQLGSMVGQD